MGEVIGLERWERFITARLNEAQEREHAKRKLVEGVVCPVCNIKAPRIPPREGPVRFACEHEIVNATFGSTFCMPAPDQAVMRDIEAKRRITEHWPDPFGNWTAEQAEAARAVKEQTLRYLASVWADHPEHPEQETVDE